MLLRVKNLSTHGEECVGAHGAKICPRHHKPAVGKARDRSFPLDAVSEGVDQNLRFIQRAIGEKCLCLDVDCEGEPAESAAVRPADDKAAIGQPGNRGIILCAGGGRIDYDRATKRSAAGIQDLRRDVGVKSGNLRSGQNIATTIPAGDA